MTPVCDVCGSYRTPAHEADPFWCHVSHMTGPRIINRPTDPANTTRLPAIPAQRQGHDDE